MPHRIMTKQGQDHVLAFLCKTNGQVLDLLWDENSFFNDPGQSLRIDELLMPSGRVRYHEFFNKLRETNFAFCKEVPFLREEEEVHFSLFGILRDEFAYVFAGQSPQQFFVVYDEFMKIINEQGRLLREAQKSSMVHRQTPVAEDAMRDQDRLLHDYMKLNNDLANMQRELTIKNRLLSAQEKRFRDLVTFNPDAQVVLSADNSMLFMNPAAKPYFENGNSENIKLLESISTDSSGELRFEVGERAVFVEVRCKELVWENKPARLVSLQDISERKEVERVKEDIQRITQHDLISPLNPIINLPSLIEQDSNITEDQKQMLHYVSSAGKRMLDMIRMSLNLYKMETGAFAFDPVCVDLVEIVQDTVGDLSSQLRSRGVSIVISVDGAPVASNSTLLITGEKTMCYSLFSNLILNSIEASHGNSTVQVVLEREKESPGNEGDAPRNLMGIASIHNTGVVPSSIRNRFFDKYVTAGKKSGTGLGTYSAKLISMTLGGDISMETSEQEGTTVVVRLPLFRASGNS